MEENAEIIKEESSQLVVQSVEDIKKNLNDLPNIINESNRSSAVETFKTLSTSSPEEVVNALQNKATIEIATNNEEVSKKIDENAKKIIDSHLNTTKNDVESKNEKSFWDRNKSAVKMYGYDKEDPRPNWQTAMMKIGSNLWFIIYWVIATFTVCPLSVFFDVFKAIFKKGWLAMVVAVIVYLIITVGIPLLSIYLPQITEAVQN